MNADEHGWEAAAEAVRRAPQGRADAAASFVILSEVKDLYAGDRSAGEVPPYLTALLLAFVCILAHFAVRGQAAEAPAQHEVDVILWFDTEDYISPADDDADKRLAELLTRRHIRATFKIVGEKARVLEQRGRKDVIAALKQHCIGFHANFHSVHPTPAEYLADCGFLDGMAEFARREGPGAADVRRIFGLGSLACYGQPGSSWASQAIAAEPLCGITVDGIPCYLDSGNHVGIGGAPFWYAGALVVYDMHPNETRMDLFAPGGLERGERDFSEIAKRLSATGGLISIYYHPCEWVTSQFWDAANFMRGANPPRSKWKLPRQRSAAETEQAFGRFEQFVDFMRSTGVRFVTACDLPSLYPDRLMTQGASPDEVLELSRRIVAAQSSGLDDQVVNGKVFSPADQFDVLALGLGRLIDQPKENVATVLPQRLLGPDAPPPADDPLGSVDWSAFSRAALDARDYLEKNHRIPPRVFIGPDAVPPADFVVGMARTWVAYQSAHAFGAEVALGHNVPVLTESHVRKDDGKLFSGWIIHPAGFRAPHIMDVAALQAWTLKPATCRE